MYDILRKEAWIENMLHLMEQYNSKLEELIESRTLEIAEEKTKVERLLYSMLPPYVLSQNYSCFKFLYVTCESRMLVEATNTSFL